MQQQLEYHNSLFRSEKMQLCQIFLQSEAAYSVVAELGELGLIQFKDLNGDLSAFQRKYVSEVRQCDDMDRILRFVESEVVKDKIKIPNVRRVPEAPPTKELRDMQMSLEKLEEDLKEINANTEALQRNYQDLQELKVILTVSQTMMAESTFSPGTEAQVRDMELGEARDTSMRLNFLSGTIPLEKVLGFERMLWFACRGNVFLRTQEISEQLRDPLTNVPILKAAFVLFFQGDQLRLKAKKICDGFKANLYAAPKSEAERTDMLAGVAQRITDIDIVLDKTMDHRRRLLVASAATLREQMIKVRKAKAVYHVMNLFNIDVTQKCLIAEAWCAVRDLDRIHVAITDGTHKAGSEIPSVLNRLPSMKKPPTFNRVNKFTRSFQNIIDAYGINTYQEVNPALFAIITFPFIFAIMFGDLGHGTIMFAAGLAMIFAERKVGDKRLDSEIANTFYGGRYLIMLMGLFSMYTGIIYNDIFSKSLNSFGSGWQVKNTTWNKDISAFGGLPDSIQLDPHWYSTNVTYPFGLDPIWQIASNKISFNNSYKMKMAVVIGIIQMMFGLALSIFNHIYFRRYYLILTQFIPEVIFICAIFGYMMVLIIAKWVTPFPNTACAPNILVGFIGMFLLQNPSSIDTYARGDCPPPLFQSLQMQFTTQTTLVLLALFCIPWLLLATPLFLLAQHKRRQRGHLFFAPPALDSESLDHASQPRQPAGAAARPGASANGSLVKELDALGLGQQPSAAAAAAAASGQRQRGGGSRQHATEVESAHDDLGEHGEKFEFGEIFVHQAIHTIEYCLGCVSNTASYLRLWALSLAHGQLSDVLWTMVLRIGLSFSTTGPVGIGCVVLFCVFIPFAVLTIAVLLLMEGLSAFLHALRLHWVEFNGKFYKGEGEKFLPFSFTEAVYGKED